MQKERTDFYKAQTHLLMDVCGINNGDPLYQALCDAYQKGRADHRAEIATKDEIIKQLAFDNRMDREQKDEEIAALKEEIEQSHKDLAAQQYNDLQLLNKADEDIRHLRARIKEMEGALDLPCLWPESIWTMTDDEYVGAVPDPRLRTAISGYLMRGGWELYKMSVEQALKVKP